MVANGAPRTFEVIRADHGSKERLECELATLADANSDLLLELYGRVKLMNGDMGGAHYCNLDYRLLPTDGTEEPSLELATVFQLLREVPRRVIAVAIAPSNYYPRSAYTSDSFREAQFMMRHFADMHRGPVKLLILAGVVGRDSNILAARSEFSAAIPQLLPGALNAMEAPPRDLGLDNVIRDAERAFISGLRIAPWRSREALVL